MAPNEPILLICHGFPPVRGIGGRRWAKFAKELARRGHPVHVIRTEGDEADLTSLWTADVQHPEIHDHPLPRRYPAVMTKRPLTTLGEKLQYRFWSKLLPLLSTGNWLDATIFWRRQLLKQAGQLIRQHGIRNVVVTGAPFRLLAFATELKQLFPSIHLVADIRDEWTLRGHYGLGKLSRKRFNEERHFEEMSVRMADKVISPHDAVLAHLQTAWQLPASHFALVAHAIDPDELPKDATRQADGFFRMIHAGALYGAEEADRYFGELLRSMATLREHRPDVYSKCLMDMYITGQGTARLVQLVEERGLADHVRIHAPLPPKEVFRQVAAADLALVFIPSANKDILGTKFNELFYLGVPILHVGEPGLVGRTILQRRMGDSIPVDELATELPRIIAGERQVDADPNADHSAYLLASVTDRLVNDVFV